MKNALSFVSAAGFLLLTLMAGVSFAGTYTIPAGSGTLTYSVTVNSKQCIIPGTNTKNTYYTSSYGTFSYAVSGTTTPLSGGDATITNGNSLLDGGCGPSSKYPTQTFIGYTVEIGFTPSGTTGGSATVTPGETGFVNPKYVVVGVTYAPPGQSSSVTYGNSTQVGNTTTLSSSFQSGVNVTVSTQGGIGAWQVGQTGFGVKITNTDSTGYTQETSSSSTVTINKTATVQYTTTGTGDAFNPVNHDYDLIWVWLNPLLIYTVFPDDSQSLQWNGYGYDLNDPSGTGGPDVFPFKVGCLNGDFGDCGYSGILARGWVNTYEPGMIWPSGEGPGLTSTDIANVLKADPFTSGYTIPPPFPSTTADGRFTQGPYPPNPIAYTQAGPGNGAGITTTYDLVYTNTSSVAQGATNTFTQAFGTEEQFSGGAFLGSFSVKVSVTDTFTWTHMWNTALTTSQNLTKALSITGPPCPQTSLPCVPTYSGPLQFIFFQDNLYGTFMFYPSPN